MAVAGYILTNEYFLLFLLAFSSFPRHQPLSHIPAPSHPSSTHLAIGSLALYASPAPFFCIINVYTLYFIFLDCLRSIPPPTLLKTPLPDAAWVDAKNKLLSFHGFFFPLLLSFSSFTYLFLHASLARQPLLRYFLPFGSYFPPLQIHLLHF